MFLSGGVQMSKEKRRRYDRDFKLEAARVHFKGARCNLARVELWCWLMRQYFLHRFPPQGSVLV